MNNNQFSSSIDVNELDCTDRGEWVHRLWAKINNRIRGWKKKYQENQKKTSASYTRRCTLVMGKDGLFIFNEPDREGNRHLRKGWK